MRTENVFVTEKFDIGAVFQYNNFVMSECSILTEISVKYSKEVG